MNKLRILSLFVIIVFSAGAQRQFTLISPDKKIQTTIAVGETISYTISCNGQEVLSPSSLSVTLENGEVWGEKAKLAGSSQKSVNQRIPAHFYRAKDIEESYNELVLRFKKDWNVEFRVYNDGVAYRFVSNRKASFNIAGEHVEYRFPFDAMASVPYVRTGDDGNYESQFFNSFENTYTVDKLSKLNKKRLMFLPLVVEAENGVKVCLTETDIENYPGLYLSTEAGENQLSGVFARYPKHAVQGGHNNLQMIVDEREAYIAKVDKQRAFPWRIAIVTTSDRDLAASNLSYLLAEPSRLDDISWIKPGKVAWEWWNDWNLDKVDFITGVNNETYKAYIDFAAEKGVEYVILDEGWAVNMQADLLQVVKELDLKAIVDYAKTRNIGIILWAGYHAFDRDMENVCRHYSEMGVKGFKVDFMDRDDQEMTAFNYRAAQTCARYKLLLDLHGTHKPAGLNRTYPNAINFEGVHGLEQMKWSPETVDQVKYDVMIPFIRQVAGPMDYTQGAMRNAAKGNFFPSNSEPMSQGTRCRQLALYVVLESPVNMLCDAPSSYRREAESADFIAKIPTVWDETIILDAKMGEYIVTARRSGDTWYIGGLTDWTARDIEVDFSFLKDKTRSLTLFEDGVNAHRIGRDYKLGTSQIDKNGKLKIHLAPGGGFAGKIE